MKKLSSKQILAISLMLFAMFFGAGNMIFPPSFGQAAGDSYLWALLGFITTDVGIAVMGIVAVVWSGKNMDDLGNKVGKRFALCLSILIYLLIGPLFALPRTSTVSFEMVAPILGDQVSPQLALFIFTALFFTITLVLSLKPNRTVDIIGKVLTPLLLLSIFIMFIGSLINPIGEIGAPTQAYESAPFFKGMIEGYLALDGPAALAFSIIVIEAIQNFGVKEKKSIMKYTIICGLFSAIFLSITYFALTYVGATSSSLGTYANGGRLLSAIAYSLYGQAGTVLLAITVILACLTTSIGLTTCFSDYFHNLYPKLSYRKLAIIVTLFSFAISNVGLTSLLYYTFPLLIMLYPITIVLMCVSFIDKKIKGRTSVYVGAMILAFVVSFVTGMDEMKISLGFFSDLIHQLPFFKLGIGWILPACIGGLLGMLPIFNFTIREGAVTNKKA